VKLNPIWTPAEYWTTIETYLGSEVRDGPARRSLGQDFRILYPHRSETVAQHSVEAQPSRHALLAKVVVVDVVLPQLL
jgi:hypothetical protein